MFRLSVLAIGRSELNNSARLMAGTGDVDDGVGCDAIEPAEDLRAISGQLVSMPNIQSRYKSSMTQNY